MDLALQTSVLDVKTLHSTTEVPDNDKGIGVRAGGGCARNDVFPIPVMYSPYNLWLDGSTAVHYSVLKGEKGGGGGGREGCATQILLI